MSFYEEITKSLIYDFKSEAELVKKISLISDAFTIKREKLNDYLKDPSLVAAYTAFYFTTNYPKFYELLKKSFGLEKYLKNCDVIEIGSGPGSFSFPISEYCEKNFWAIETSALMREQASKLKEELFKDSKVEFISGIKSIPKKENERVLIFSNSFNEMGEEAAFDYIRKLQADHILFIEPGTKEVFQNLLKLRESLIGKKFNIHYPCGLNSSCPLSDSDDWCHQYFKLSLDLDIQRISQLVKINRKWQAACVFFFSKEENKRDDRGIIYRSHPPTKFSLEWDVCYENEISRLQTRKRDISKSEFKSLKEKLAGDIV